MYKKGIQIVAIVGLLIAFMGCSSGSKLKSKEQVGNYVFELLETINVKSLEETVDLFATKSDIEQYLKEFSQEESSESKYYKVIDEETAEKPEYLYTAVNTIKRDAAKYGIEWDKVIYLDFIVPHFVDKKEYRGELFIKYDEKVYAIFVDFITLKDKYYLTNLSGIQRVSR